MDEQRDDAPRPVRPRRRKRSQMQIFKETYLPVVITGVALVLIIIFIAGSVTRAAERRAAEKAASIATAESIENEAKRLAAEASELLAQAEALAKGYNYLDAIAVLDSFSGDMSGFSELEAKRTEYANALAQTVAWQDPNDVVNLSFQTLIADAQRAFNDAANSKTYKRSYITTEEFSNILQQLYDNGYMLISLADLAATSVDSEGNTVFTPKTLYLPQGKKPLILTQTGVNYYTSLVDSDKDGLADKGGGGFASRLVIGQDGNITCEMVDSEGNTVTGDYDLVPILDAFIEAHPDFSYDGAKAVLAVTGYDGLFGYRTNASAKDRLGVAAYAEEQACATAIADALRADGYELACNTYADVSYGERSATEILADLDSWETEVAPVLGNVDILVYAQTTDITDAASYSGEKYEALRDAGFRYYLSFSNVGGAWADVMDEYIRQGRILVSGTNLTSHPEWFEGLFDAESVLDANR